MKHFFIIFVISFLHKHVSAFHCPVDSNQHPINGVYRDSSKCNVYYHCVNGTSFLQQCPTGYHFKSNIADYQYFACIPASQSDCFEDVSSAETNSMKSHSMLKSILSKKNITSQLLNNGSWTEWSRWSDCNQSCGEGTRNRTRVCKNLFSSNGIKVCEGESSETEQCYMGSCNRNSNPAFMVYLDREKQVVGGKIIWTTVNLNTGGLFNPTTNSVSVTKSGLYILSMVFTCSKRKSVEAKLLSSGRDLGIHKIANSLASGPETVTRASLHVFSPIYRPIISQRVGTSLYSSEYGKETSWLGFCYNSDNYISLGSTSTLSNPKVSWPIIMNMKGFREKSDLTEFQALTGGLYFFSMGMKAESTGRDTTTMELAITRNNMNKRTFKAFQVSIANATLTDQFSRSFLMEMDERDVFITRVRGESPRSSLYLESYLFAFKLNTSYPYFMGSRTRSTCDEFQNIEFPTIRADSTNSWDKAKSHYRVAVAGTYYIDYSFELQEKKSLDIRMFLNDEIVAISKKRNDFTKGYILTRSILLNLKVGDILKWENYGCLGYIMNESTLTIIYVS